MKIKENLQEASLHLRISHELFNLFKKMASEKDIGVSCYIRILMKRELVRNKYVSRNNVHDL